MNQKKFDQLRSLLDIKKFDLCEASQDHAHMHQEVCMEVSNANLTYELAHVAVEDMEADLDGFYRQECAANGTKLTEAQLKAMVERNPDLRKLKLDRLYKKKELDDWKGLERNFQSRERRIDEDLCMVRANYKSYQHAEQRKGLVI